jgi:hypothetical protein
MLHSRSQLAVSDKPIHVNSNLNSCYAVAAASGVVPGAYSAKATATPRLRQDGLHSVVIGSTINSFSSFDSLWMQKRTEAEGKPTAASRSQALNGLRTRRRGKG